MRTIDGTPQAVRGSVFDLPRGSRLLAMFAHPDDETLAAAALRLSISQGFDVYSLTASDGEASTKGDRQFVTSGGRRAEVKQSLGYIGIDTSRQYYYGLPDGQLGQPDIQQKLVDEATSLITSLGITAIITTGSAGVDGHPDHQAVHTAATKAADSLPGASLTIAGLSHRHSGEYIVGFPAAYKQPIIDCHHSQFGTPEDRQELDGYGPLITAYETYDVIRYTYNKGSHEI